VCTVSKPVGASKPGFFLSTLFIYYACVVYDISYTFLYIYVVYNMSSEKLFDVGRGNFKKLVEYSFFFFIIMLEKKKK
jgi:hypothetical protein